MKILITGAGGQLGWELQRSAPAGCILTCCSSTELDITDAQAIERSLEANTPDAVINAAAYTAVDKAEADADAAMAVNQTGVRNLARASALHGNYLLHISTDFVFDGLANQPYVPSDSTHPLNVYGVTKLAGEHEITAAMPRNWGIIRTGWVYSSHGNNFVKTMLRLMRERPELKVVSDQLGTPTWAAGLASACWACIDGRLEGKYHWSDAGVASWYDFALAIRTLALEKGLLADCIPVAPIATADYPTAARRPVYSVLDKKQLLAAAPTLRLEHWQLQLSSMLDELKEK